MLWPMPCFLGRATKVRLVRQQPAIFTNILWALGTFGLIDGSTVSGLTCQPLPEPASWG